MILPNGTSERTSRLLRFKSRSCFADKSAESKCIEKKYIVCRPKTMSHFFFTDHSQRTPLTEGAKHSSQQSSSAFSKALAKKCIFIFVFKSPHFTFTIRAFKCAVSYNSHASYAHSNAIHSVLYGGQTKLRDSPFFPSSRGFFFKFKGRVFSPSPENRNLRKIVRPHATRTHVRVKKRR